MAVRQHLYGFSQDGFGFWPDEITAPQKTAKERPRLRAA
jgi:hypothetical protein